MKGAIDRALLLGTRMRELGTVLRRARLTHPEHESAGYVLDLLDPVGYALACALSKRYRLFDPARMVRAAFERTPPARPVQIGELDAAELAEVIEAALPKLGTVAAKLRAPAPDWHVLTLIAGGVGAEVVPIDTMTFGLDVAMALED